MVNAWRIPFLLLSPILLFSFGCASTIPFELKQTEVAPPIIFGETEAEHFPEKLIFLGKKEASCPNQCSEVVKSQANLKKWVSHIEQRLQERGYKLISGAIVSRVEGILKENETRETWDRTEKALLLGKETGADAIFEVRALWGDLRKNYFINRSGEPSFKEVSGKYAEKLIKEDLEHARISRLIVPYWVVQVELRMLDMDGNIIWTATMSVKTTDIMPEAWKAEVNDRRPDAAIVRKGRRKQQNFDYDMYYYDNLLQEEQFVLIIDELIKKLPKK